MRPATRLEMICLGIAEGARLVCGGLGRPKGLTRGFYVRPTVFCAVHPQMKIAQEEIFGPVLAVIPYDRVDEAVEIANGTGARPSVAEPCHRRRPHP